jgi:hypothetical protein
MAYDLKLNGERRSADVDGDTPLLWVIRDVLGMTGTKYGCGIAQCGACTVHIDGQPVRSCQTPVESVGNTTITTIEAITRLRTASGFRRPGRISTWCSADTASPDRSCRRRLCYPRSPIRQMPTSTTPCPATSVAVAPMFAFAQRSDTPQSWMATRSRGAENAHVGIFLKDIAPAFEGAPSCVPASPPEAAC